MAVVTYAPGCVASWTSNAVSGSAPVRLPKVLHADTIISLAPSVGTANLVLDDPAGVWAGKIKPNDGINITFTSRKGGAANLGQLSPGPASAWAGLVNSAVPAYDPRSQYGRALKINASTMWKPLVVTSVPLQFFFSGQYPTPGMPLLSLFQAAIVACQENLGIGIPSDFTQSNVPIQTSFTNVPNEMDTNDPQSQSWAAYLMNMLTAAGVEAYAREDGWLIIRDFQGMANPAVASMLSIPAAELFASSGAGVSDEGLVTNAVVSWSTNPQSDFAAVAPSGNLSDIGPLPPQLLDGNGKALRQIGQRFNSYSADFINQPGDAERYASNIRSVGLAKVDQFQGSMALNGDIRIGSFLLLPSYNRRYYVTTVAHSFEDQQDAETNVTGCFGVPPGYVWNQAAMAGAGMISLSGAGPSPAGWTTTTQPANLPLPSDPQDPDIRWLPGMAVISTTDIATALQQAGSPFADQAVFIWQGALKYGINPAFALAVWQEECGLGTNPNAVTDLQNHNPGSLGVTSTAGGGADYGTWQAGIDAWYQTIAGPTYLGAGLYSVSQVANVYDHDNAASWQQNVAQYMVALISAATAPGVGQPGGPPPPGATGSMGAVAQYADTLAQSIPANSAGVHNVLQSGTPLGAFVNKAGYLTVQCTIFVQYLMAKIGGIAGIVNTNGSINTTGLNASQWRSYLTGLGFTEQTGNGPLPGDVLLFNPGEVDPRTGKWQDLSEGDGHVGVITAVTQPDANNAGGSITLASANVPDPVDSWALTKSGSAYRIGHLADGGFFGATPFGWFRHS